MGNHVLSWNGLGRESGEYWPVLSKLLPIIRGSARFSWQAYPAVSWGEKKFQAEKYDTHPNYQSDEILICTFFWLGGSHKWLSCSSKTSPETRKSQGQTRYSADSLVNHTSTEYNNFLSHPGRATRSEDSIELKDIIALCTESEGLYIAADGVIGSRKSYSEASIECQTLEKKVQTASLLSPITFKRFPIIIVIFFPFNIKMFLIFWVKSNLKIKDIP